MMNEMPWAAVAIAASLSTAACATTQAATDPVGVTATYTKLVDDIYGTRQQRLDEDRRVWAAFQQGIADCMNKAGSTYAPPPFEATGGRVVSPDDLTSIAPIGLKDFGEAGFRESLARAMNTTSGIPSGNGNRSLGDCASAGRSENMWFPVGSLRLIDKLTTVFRDIEKRPTVQEKLGAYGSCMQQAGFPVQDYQGLRDQIAQHYPVPAPWAEQSRTSAWTEAVGYEKRITAADTRCRTDLHDTAMTCGAAKVQELVHDNAAALTAIRQQRAGRDALPIPTVTNK